VTPQWRFYQNEKGGKIYYIRIGSPEDAEVTRLMPDDSDDEWEEGSQAEQLVFRYFIEHAHRVEVMGQKSEPKDAKGGQE